MAERSRSLAAPPEASSSNVLSLTSALLSALPKRNSEQFLLAYAQEQRRFRKEYAADGQKEVASWNQLGQDPAYKADLAQSSSSGKLGNFVFGTPVLKARVSKSGADAPSMHLRKSQDKAPVRVTTGVVVETQLPATAVREQTTSESVTLALKSTRHNNATGSNAIPATLRNDNKAKKRSIHRDNSSNDEQENRLSERQQRKKVKKDIMKPKTKGNSDEEKSLERSRSHKQRKNLTKAQTGFALMHGFSATNVGKNRLTLDPLLHNTGVFKKGKASNATKVPGKQSKKQDTQATYFSESKFLNKKRAATGPSAPSPSTCVSVSSHLSSEPRKKRGNTSKKIKIPRHTPPSSKALSKIGRNSESASPKSKDSHAPYNPENSIIWDIEKESCLPESQAPSDERQGTILVSFPKALSQPQEEICRTSGIDSINDLLGKPGGDTRRGDSQDRTLSTISLGPSQSASQGGVKETVRLPSGTSKYFKSMATIPVVPQEPIAINGEMDVQEIAPEPFVPANFDPLHMETGCDYFTNDEKFGSMNPGCSHDAMDIDDQVNPPVDSSDSVPVEAVCRDSGLNEASCFWSQVPWDDDVQHELDVYLSSSIDLDALLDTDFRNEESWPQDIESHSLSEDHIPSDLLWDAPYDDPGDYLLVGACFAQPEEQNDFAALGTAPQGTPVQDPWPNESLLPVYDSYDSPEREQHLDLDYMNTYVEEGQETLSYVESERSGHCDSDSSNELEIDNFYQGRSLLYGLKSESGKVSGSNRLLNVEAEVAGLLKQNHWLPQRL